MCLRASRTRASRRIPRQLPPKRPETRSARPATPSRPSTFPTRCTALACAQPHRRVQAHPCARRVTAPVRRTREVRRQRGSSSATPRTPEPRSACRPPPVSCHSGGPRNHWLGSVHQRNDVSCSDCHNPMAEFSVQGSMARLSISETCAPATGYPAQFNRRSHMPLPEGQMSCADCHNPHGSLTAPLLKTNTVNETCYQCHAEKRGPFLFEHAPVRGSCSTATRRMVPTSTRCLSQPYRCLASNATPSTPPNDLLTAQSLATGLRIRMSGSWAAAASPVTRTFMARTRRPARDSIGRRRRHPCREPRISSGDPAASAASRRMRRARLPGARCRTRHRHGRGHAVRHPHRPERAGVSWLRRGRHELAQGRPASHADRIPVSVSAADTRAGDRRRLALLGDAAARFHRRRRRRQCTVAAIFRVGRGRRLRPVQPEHAAPR